MSKADFTLQAGKADDQSVVVALKGDWTAIGLRDAGERLKVALKNKPSVRFDLNDLQSFDTAGAYALRSVLKERDSDASFEGHENYQRIYALVCGLDAKIAEAGADIQRRKAMFSPVTNMLADVGRVTTDFFDDLYQLIVFIGHIISVSFLSLINPRRIRWTPLIAQMQRVGLEALLVVGVTNFFVGSVIAFLGVLQLKAFGASVFAIELIGISVLREFGPVLAAVLLAGRSASSFTAEIGAMKMNQEIDAMRVMGINPFDALILPRFFGMIIMMPLVSFFGAMAGLLGGMVVVWTVLGYGPHFFIQRMTDYVPFVNYFVGLIKTPFFAAAIAIIGCRLGMTVTSDVISLGKQVTKSVVHAIFTIILINAAFAMMFNGFDFG